MYKAKASIIVCSQNHKTVKRLIDNVSEQVPNTFEFVPVLNAKSIATGYNAGAKQAKTDVLVFLHDDLVVRFGSKEWEQFVGELKKDRNGIGGVAGFRKVDYNQGKVIWPPPGGFGSGGVLHEDEGYVWYTTYGLFGRTITLDGIFLAMRREVFEELDGFDTDYPGWHFYDSDITLRSFLLSYRNFTYPLLIQHGSANYNKDGSCKDQVEFNKHAQIFWKKHMGLLPQVIEADNQELENRVFSREPRWGQIIKEKLA